MKFILLLAAIALIAPHGGQSSILVPPSCRNNADTAATVIQKVQRIVSSYDSTRLAGVGLLSVDTSAVAIVTSDSVCALAVSAFNAARPTAAPGVGPTAVFVVQAGAQRYVVFEPTYKSGEFIDLLVFSSDFTLLGWILG